MYDRLMSRAMRTLWALEPSKLAILADLLRFRASGGRLTAEEIQARIGEPPPAPTPSKRDGAIAVIPVFGLITHRMNSFEAMSGGTSTELLGKYIQRAVADDGVKSILLDIASPGGSVEGLPELAALIAAAAKVKTVVATANAQACSAAYWLGSQASEFVVTPSGHVGSIGVYMLTEDLSEHLAKEGIKINAISAGEHKLDGAPWEPLDDETRAFLQAQVDAVYADFVRAVASGRSVSVATVNEQFGQGRVFNAKQAVKLGLVDAIETFDETVARMMKKAPKGYRSRAVAEGDGLPIVALGDAAIEAAADFEEAFSGVDLASGPDATGTVVIGPDTTVVEASEPTVAEDAADLEAEADARAAATREEAAAKDYIDAGIRIAERL